MPETVRLLWVGDRVCVTGGEWEELFEGQVGIVHRLDAKDLGKAICKFPSGIVVTLHIEELTLASAAKYRYGKQPPP